MIRDPWLAFRRPTQRCRVRLLCFPHAGGGASFYARWASALPPEIEVCAMQPPGREARLGEPPHTAIAPLVDELACVVSRLSDRPYAFFGHSLGSFVAFELARELERRGAPAPAHVFVSGTPPPGWRPEPPIHGLPDAEFLAKVRGYGGMPDEVVENAELVELVLPILRADFALAQTCRAGEGASIACPLTALGGDKDVDAEGLEAWRPHARGRFGSRLFSGGHFYLADARPAVLDLVCREVLPTPSALWPSP